MKLRLFFTGVIFVFSGLVARGQVQEILYQGFETGETSRVWADPASNMSYSTTYYSTGSRSLEVSQSTQDVTLFLDTLDFTNDLTLRYIRLEFDHICQIPLNQGENLMGKIYYKRANQTDAQYVLVGSSYYNMSEGGSGGFNALSAFNTRSYDEWNTNTTTNEMWRSERFDLNNILNSSLAPEERK